MSIASDHVDRIVQSLVEQELISHLLGPIKSGKEASVLACRAHPMTRERTGYDRLALKIFRPRTQRSFKNDAVYREGSMIHRIGGGNTRAARALRNGTRFGREVQETTWCGHEWHTLCLLHDRRLPVPEPVHSEQNTILMELFVTRDGSIAAPLANTTLPADVAPALFQALCDDVEQMLALDLLHGDLSPYNVLWNGEEYRIIDFPQACDPRFNGNAPWILQRDIENVARFCARFGTLPDPAEVSANLWARFQRGEL